MSGATSGVSVRIDPGISLRSCGLTPAGSRLCDQSKQPSATRFWGRGKGDARLLDRAGIDRPQRVRPLSLDKFAGHRGVGVAAAEFSTVNSLFLFQRARVHDLRRHCFTDRRLVSAHIEKILP
jgi:hypothetical protein